MINNLIFLDTSALYPLFIKRDTLNELSKEILKDLTEKYKTRFFTTTWIEYETLSKLKKHGIDFCLKFERFLKKADVSIENVSKTLENNALKFFWNYKDKEWSIIDCASIHLMFDKNVSYVFACDNHFSQAGLFPLMEFNVTQEAQKTYSELYFY